MRRARCAFYGRSRGIGRTRWIESSVVELSRRTAPVKADDSAISDDDYVVHDSPLTQTVTLDCACVLIRI